VHERPCAGCCYSADRLVILFVLHGVRAAQKESVRDRQPFLLLTIADVHDLLEGSMKYLDRLGWRVANAEATGQVTKHTIVLMVDDNPIHSVPLGYHSASVARATISAASLLALVLGEPWTLSLVSAVSPWLSFNTLGLRRTAAAIRRG
jgi:hypothetical protein